MVSPSRFRSFLVLIASYAEVSAFALQTVNDRLASLFILPTEEKSPPVGLEAQSAPLLQLRHQHSILELSTNAIDYWRPMGFEPFGGQKDVIAFVIYEEGGLELTTAIKGWCSKLADTYQVSLCAQSCLVHALIQFRTGIEIGFAHSWVDGHLPRGTR